MPFLIVTVAGEKVKLSITLGEVPAVFFLTSIVTLLLIPFLVPVTTAVPIALAVTLPNSSMVATSSLLLV